MLPTITRAIHQVRASLRLCLLHSIRAPLSGPFSAPGPNELAKLKATSNSVSLISSPIETNHRVTVALSPRPRKLPNSLLEGARYANDMPDSRSGFCACFSGKERDGESKSILSRSLFLSLSPPPSTGELFSSRSFPIQIQSKAVNLIPQVCTVRCSKLQHCSAFSTDNSSEPWSATMVIRRFPIGQDRFHSKRAELRPAIPTCCNN